MFTGTQGAGLRKCEKQRLRCACRALFLSRADAGRVVIVSIPQWSASSPAWYYLNQLQVRCRALNLNVVCTVLFLEAPTGLVATLLAGGLLGAEFCPPNFIC